VIDCESGKFGFLLFISFTPGLLAASKGAWKEIELP
jgi:hypothetical protein